MDNMRNQNSLHFQVPKMLAVAMTAYLIENEIAFTFLPGDNPKGTHHTFQLPTSRGLAEARRFATSLERDLAVEHRRNYD